MIVRNLYVQYLDPHLTLLQNINEKYNKMFKISFCQIKYILIQFLCLAVLFVCLFVELFLSLATYTVFSLSFYMFYIGNNRHIMSIYLLISPYPSVFYSLSLVLFLLFLYICSLSLKLQLSEFCSNFIRH